MSGEAIGLAIGLGLIPLLAPRIATGAAVDRLRAAIEDGKAGRENDFLVHSKAALAHLTDAGTARRDPNAFEALIRLKAAIDSAEQKQMAAATKHAERALALLEAVTG